MNRLLKGFAYCSATLWLIAGGTMPALAQDYDVQTTTQHLKGEYRPNQVIVKFKDESSVAVKAPGRMGILSTNVSTVDEVFAKIGVDSLEQLMPLTGSQPASTIKVKAFNDAEVEIPASMEKVYLLSIRENNVQEAVSQLKALDEVEYAEPNYLVHALETDTPNDPMYSQQWGLGAINIAPLWQQPTISDSPIIAILDTGVDTEHPDLKDNIWTNTREVEGVEGYDDDGNGFTDDLHGYDFVNQTGTLADYNGHGTHCAGIAAATGNNEVGIIGANPDAQIMVLTVLQSNGQGDIGTLIRAIDYATANGADVLSMSLGTYSNSSALEQALGRAYQNAFIVAAAGNDGYCLNHAHPKEGQSAPMPMFPAAYTFVLGVQASAEGGLASFSNYDDDGATYSSYSEEKLYNYEVMAPGVSVLSTYPNGQYKSLNGTSMATPLVAGALSRLIQTKECSNKEEVFGDLINCRTANGDIDFAAAFACSDANRKPELQIVNFVMEDADGDGRADAGEEVAIYPVVRNTRGNASNIQIKLDVAELANNFCEIVTAEADFGSNLSAYGKAQSTNPLRVKFNDNVADGRICSFSITASCDSAETVAQEISITVESGTEIGGVIAQDTTLSEGTYIVTQNLAIPEGVTLTIEPGSTLKFKDGKSISSSGSIKAIGTPEKRITFTKTDLGTGALGYTAFSFSGNDDILFEYCVFKDFSASHTLFGSAKYHHCTFDNLQTNYYWSEYDALFSFCIFTNCTNDIINIITNSFEKCNFSQNSNNLNFSFASVRGSFMSNNIIGNNTDYGFPIPKFRSTSV